MRRGPLLTFVTGVGGGERTGLYFYARGRARVSAGSIRAAAGASQMHIFTAQYATYASVRGLSIINSGRLDKHTCASVRRCRGTRCNTRILWHALHGNRRPVERCEQPDRPVATRARGRGRTGRSEDLIAGLTPGSAHCTGLETAWLGVGLRAD